MSSFELLLEKNTAVVRVKKKLLSIAGEAAKEHGMSVGDYVSYCIYEQIMRERKENEEQQAHRQSQQAEGRAP